MATRKPLVVVSGQLQEMPTGDAIASDPTKQDALVSGTNIKTVNGSSLLGSGNLVIAAGSGAPDFLLLNTGII